MQHHQQQQLDKISVLDIIVGKSRALTSLQNRGTNLTLSGVTNISTIAMDVPLRPQEVHDLVNRVERTTTKKRLGTRRKNTLSSNINAHPLEAEQSILSTSKRRNFEAHITAHCQGMTFSRTVLSTLKDQHKIGILFWLNYRNTYGHWNEQRRAFTTPTCDSTRLRSIVNVPTSPETTKELNIMFQLDGIQVSLEYEMRCEARIGSSGKIYNSEKS
ncbi:unnamed protein product [Rotaria magnacalcarata]|uniref:Uncharacterized protein n=2 Tax=Rotaria magnacalcarata TaxID=392030 RepID=A0A816MJB8_9BILA|nr:unnamed protein product [Rotaria magnacalcarata]CAF4319556.1 unnamed protein product [Rotaria magnacalcarata]